MRILSWNINGIRTLPQYHPWNELKTGEAILDHLGADIVCFQEMKSSRAALGKDVAVPGHFNSLFSFPVTKGGYSGVAVYTNTRICTPIAAQEGLLGTLQPKIPLSLEECVYKSELTAEDIPHLFPDDSSNTHANLTPLDSEGRTLAVDFGLFVLINLYCPNETSDARLPFKMNFHLTLQERVRRLVEEERRQVIVVGDINVCSTPLDHCDGHLASVCEAFYDHPARQWLKDWLGGGMIDAVRKFWPGRQGMYTCWNQKISARESNYGTRIDYFLVTPGLLPWIKGADIQASVKGSDHCPIYIDLHDSITLELGETLSLEEAMRNPKDQPPRISAKFWDEYSGKQKLLSSFFTKKGPLVTPSSLSPSAPSSQETETFTTATPPPSLQPDSRAMASSKRKLASPSEHPLKTKKTKPSPSASSLEKGQSKLSVFFNKSTPLSDSIIDLTDDIPSPDVDAETLAAIARIPDITPEVQKQQWSNLLSPIEAPKCSAHGEPAKEFTTKQGKNKGKKFWVCSRPVGPGYDKGRSERRREEVDPQYKCDFFKWSSDVRRDAKRNAGKG